MKSKINATVLLALLVGCAWWLPPAGLDILFRICVFAVLTLSLELVMGTTGLVSFVQAAFLGVGAYSVAAVQAATGVESGWILLGAAVLSSLLVGLAVGLLSIRTHGIYFIMVTLAFAQMLYHFVHDTPLLGGSDGIYLNGHVYWSLPGHVRLSMSGDKVSYLSALAVLVLCWWLAHRLLASRFGHAVQGIGSSEQRMRAVGYPTFAYKLGIFTLAAGMAGIAGFLQTSKGGLVMPDALSWHQSAIALIMVIMGGIGSLRGAVIGAVFYVALQEVLSSTALLGKFADHWVLMFGIAMILIVALLPEGLDGWLKKNTTQHRGAQGSDGVPHG